MATNSKKKDIMGLKKELSSTEILRRNTSAGGLELVGIIKGR
jgi:hypothetical protein